MAGEADDQVLEQPPDQVDTSNADVAVDTSTEPDPAARAEPRKRMSVRESIQDAIKQASRPTEDKNTKPPADKAGAAAPGPKAGDKVSTPPQGSSGTATAVPDAWKNKELLAHWNGFPPAVQAAIQKREEIAAKGIEQLKARYQDTDNAIAPYRESIKRFGFTDAQAIDQLFKWQMALAGPDKIRAFVSLLQSHGVDPATFAAAITGGAAPQPNQPQQQIQLPPQVLQELDGIKNKLGQYDAQFAQQTRSAAEQTVTNWAKDKPHYDKVKLLMGQLIQSGAAKPTEGDPFALDAAYNMAVRAHPDAYEAFAQEQRDKEAEARKATADKARKAGSSMRTGAPVPPAQANGAVRDQRNETVRDSIKRALAELRQ